MSRIYVKIRADFDENGIMLPRLIIWEDGRKFPIDRVSDIRQAASMKSGGQGDRYTIILCGETRYLFFERSANSKGNIIGRWFIES